MSPVMPPSTPSDAPGPRRAWPPRALAWASLLLVPWFAASSCAEEAQHGELAEGAAAGSAFMDVTIAALTFDGVGDAVWDLRVANAGPETVLATRLSSARFGDGAGSASYVSPCDASAGANPNTVEVRLLGLYAEPVAELGAHGSPAPSGALPAQLPDLLTQDVPCVANADQPVRFDVTILRPAEQGFVDIAVNFNDLHCSAKYDCGAEDLLFDGATRSTTHILGLACVGPSAAPTLYLDAIAIDCGGAGSVSLDPAPATDGNQGAVAIASDRGLFQWAVFRGQEETGATHRSYWNVALGVDDLSGCTVSTRGTADRSEVLDTGAIPAGVVYPFITWDVPLDGCTENQPLSFTEDGEDPAPVTVAYTATGDDALTFAHRFPGDPDPTCDDGILNGDETDVDCGGSCDPCAVAATCDHDGDCATGMCGPGDDGTCDARICRDAPYLTSVGEVSCLRTDGLDYEVHAFTSTGSTTFIAPEGVHAVELLVVAGGGGGGGDNGGGGGAGGLIYYGPESPNAGSSYPVAPGSSYGVTVGAGGAGSAHNTDDGSSGESSAFDALVAVGGGRGASGNAGLAVAQPGGSGGGGEGETTNASQWAGAAGTAGQGHGGGSGSPSASAGAGGGGGAGEPGGDARSTLYGGHGGDGLAYAITGVSTYYAGGGAGGSENSVFNNPGLGGLGGGSDGGTRFPASGAANTGGGGAGSTGPSPSRGGDGGSGIVVVRFLVP